MDQGIVIDSVKKMLSSGLDAQTIKYTLLDLGLSEREADDALSIAQGNAPSSPSPAPSPTAPVEPPFVKSPAAPPVYESYNAPPTPSPSAISQQVLASTTATQLAMDEHKEKLADVHSSVSDLHEKVDSLSSSVGSSPDVLSKLSLLSNRLAALEHEITELKAQGSGLQSILSKVLETNRDVLLELQRRPMR